MEITFLGTGTSQGVPVIACKCEVCTSTDSKNTRLRSSILISHEGKNVVIDTGPDFRAQMLNNKVEHLNAVVYTHEHKDHVAGLDDVRAYNYSQKQDMPIYATTQVQDALKREFHYIFASYQYPGIPKVKLNTIDYAPFDVDGIQFTPIEVLHYKLPVKAFRVGDFCYITDAKTIAKAEKEKMKGAKVIVVNALRKEEHISHFNLEQALEFINEIKPERAYLTHISHLMGKHEDVRKLLPVGVDIAYDGLTINVD
ncbi:MAG: MBL fold metallo-hydrolase [Flavobacteriales bacterium]